MKWTGIYSGLPMLEPAKRGTPPHPHLAELDTAAAAEVIAGVYPTDHAAAKAYISRYTDRVFGSEDTEALTYRLKRIAKRIKKTRLTIVEARN